MKKAQELTKLANEANLNISTGEDWDDKALADKTAEIKQKYPKALPIWDKMVDIAGSLSNTHADIMEHPHDDDDEEEDSREQDIFDYEDELKKLFKEFEKVKKQ
jgi:hypothetical protein